MAKLWRIEYSVKCRFNHMNAFPIDMLRYDDSQPASTEDWDLIIQSHANAIAPKEAIDSKPIKLVHYSHGNKRWQPTFDRWRSFTWEVIEVNSYVREVG